MQKIKENKKILCLVLAVITVLCESIEIINGSLAFSNGNNYKWILEIFLMYFLIDKATKRSNKRLIICSLIFGVIISICAITGHIAENFFAPNYAISKRQIIVFICKFEVCMVSMTSIASIIMKTLPHIMKKIKDKYEINFFTSNKKSIFVIAGILFIAYLPYILYYYPGNVLIDSTIQIMQGMGDLIFTAHHPPIHTAIIAICLKIGNFVFGNYNFGVFIYTLIQTLATCFIFSFTLYYMAKKGVPKKIRIISLIFYAFNPIISFLTITMYKDIPFALAMLVLTICTIEIATNCENFLKNKLRIVLTIIAVFLVSIFRNNGLYAMILTLPFLMIMLKENKLKIGAIFLAGIIMCMIVIGPIYKLFNIEKGSTRESLSVVLQQYARIIKYKNEELTQEEKNAIKKYLPADNLAELYNPVFADPVKTQFSDKAFKEDKITLLKTYIHLAIKYPTHTIASLICNSFGYYYPNTLGWGVYTGVNNECFSNNGVDYGIHQNPIIQIKVLDKINEFVNSRNIPIISMFLSIGFLFWVFVFGIMYSFYTKKYNLILSYIPIFTMWITILASPVFGEPRYVYSLFTCLPLLLGMSFKENE